MLRLNRSNVFRFSKSMKNNNGSNAIIMEENKTYCYQLWGNDTFSNETYLCGVYMHYSSAHRAMRQRIKRNLTCQDEGLRDTYWITRTTVEEHNAAVDAREALIKSVHEQIEHDVACVETVLVDFEEFMKSCTKDLGDYEFPLPESFSQTCIKSLSVVYRKGTGARVKVSFDVMIELVDMKHEDVRQTTAATYAFGRRDKVAAEIANGDFIPSLRDFFTKMIQRFYFKKLEY